MYYAISYQERIIVDKVVPSLNNNVVNLKLFRLNVFLVEQKTSVALKWSFLQSGNTATKQTTQSRRVKTTHLSFNVYLEKCIVCEV